MAKSAVVKILDVQMRVKEGDIVKAPLMDTPVGETVEFGEVLMVSGDDAVQVGQPHVEGASVTAEVMEHGRDKKIIVFKMKRRKGYRRRNGHRQSFTQLKIASIRS